MSAFAMSNRVPMTGLISQMSRLLLRPAAPVVGILHHKPCLQCIHTHSPLQFQVTDQLWAAPMKKKKKLDPAVLMARENKRKKKIEKQMKRLEKFGRTFKPIEEIEGDPKIQRVLEMRQRPPVMLEFEEKERRALLHKEWTRMKLRQHIKERLVWANVVQSQQIALEELRFESEELYQKAIQCDESLIPLEFRGTTQTPPNQDYEAPDGEYIDTTKTFE